MLAAHKAGVAWGAQPVTTAAEVLAAQDAALPVQRNRAAARLHHPPAVAHP